MSSDNQYTALGPAAIGFQTNSTDITAGADISGNTVGVRAKCDDGNGVEGSSVHGYGLKGLSDGSAGVTGFGDPGLFGVQASGNATGGTGAGVIGVKQGPGGGPGLYGIHTSTVLIGGELLPHDFDNDPDLGPLGEPGAGVHGVSKTGIGIVGHSRDGSGVQGDSTRSDGVTGRSKVGYGGRFGGGLAPLRLDPATAGGGAPTTGNHQKGEFFVDSKGGLFFCKADGVPGTWVQLA